MRGTLILCKEEMDVAQEIGANIFENIYFQAGVLYTALLGNTITVISREHKAIEINNYLLDRHFEIKQFN